MRIAALCFATWLMTGCSAAEAPNPVVAAASPAESSKPAVEKAKNAATQDQIRAKLEAMAKKAETAALAKKESIMRDLVAEHDADVAAYRFKCARWGDWLEISIARRQPKEKTEKFSTSINLGMVTTVHLEPGNAPDEDGKLSYQAEYVSDKNKDEGWFGSSGGYELSDPPAGYHWEIKPEFPVVPENYQIFYETPHNTGQVGSWCCAAATWGVYPVALETKNYPRAAKDDEIALDGIATIYVPAGLGEKVYRDILAAKDPGGN